MKNKLVAALALVVLVAPGISFAQTTNTQLEAELQSLLAQLAALQSKASVASAVTVGAGTTTTSTAGSNMPIICPAWGCNGPEPITPPIKIAPSVIVLTPKAGETLQAVTKYTITWSNMGISSNATQYISIANGTSWSLNDPNATIVSGLSATTTSYTWTVTPNNGWGLGMNTIEQKIAGLLGIKMTLAQSVAESDQYVIAVGVQMPGVTGSVAWGTSAPFTITTGGSGNGTQLAVTKNTALGNQTISPGTAHVKIGSYSFSAAPIQGINVNTVDIKIAPNAGKGATFQNLQLMVNGVQFGTTQAAATNNSVYAFSGQPFVVPAGATVNVDVYAGTLSSASGTIAPATAVAGYAATGATSNMAITSTSTVNGQTITLSNPPALTVSADSTNPPAGRIVDASTGDTLAAFRLTATGNTESIAVSKMNVVAAVASTKTVEPAFSNVTLWNGPTELGVAQAPIADAAGTGYIYTFNSFSSPVIVPAGNAVTLTLKGDAAPYTSGAVTDGSSLTFGIATTSDATNDTPALAVAAHGVTSNESAKITLLNAQGNPQQVVRTTLSVSSNPLSGQPAQSFQQIGSVVFTANAAGDAVLNTLKLTTNQTGAAFLNSVVLKDQNGNDIVATDGFAKTSISGNAITWTFAPSTKPLDITAGSSYTLTIWADLSKLPSASGIAQSLSVSIANAGDFSYYDGANNTAIVLTLLPTQVPLTLVNLTFAPGTSNVQVKTGASLSAIVSQSAQSWWNALVHIL